MNIQIEKLSELFRQKFEIERQISECLAGDNLESENKPVRHYKKLKKHHKKHQKYKKSEGFRTDKNHNYVCEDCRNNFDSKLPRIDVICPKCKSIHVIELKSSKRWTKEEDEELLYLKKSGKTHQEIADELARTEKSITLRVYKLIK